MPKTTVCLMGQTVADHFEGCENRWSLHPEPDATNSGCV
jgi:hypothetical protein